MGHFAELLQTETVQTLILVCCLLLEGAVIKHAGIFSKIPNKTVPFILMITSIIVCIIYCGNGTDAGTIVNAILTAVSATGLHQTGKITMNTVPELIANFRSNINAPDVGDIETVKEESETAENMVETIEQTEKIVDGIIEQVKKDKASETTDAELELPKTPAPEIMDP